MPVKPRPVSWPGGRVMPFEWSVALSELRVAVERLLGGPFGSPDLPPLDAERLRALLPAVCQAPGGRVVDWEYRVPIVAPMKAGKSTLLNALLCQDLLPVRGPAMTVLPTRVTLMTGTEHLPPVLTLTGEQSACLARLAARLAKPGCQDAVAAALQRFPLLEDVAGTIDWWQSRTDTSYVGGRKGVRQHLSKANDLLRLALSALPGDDVLTEVAAFGAVEVSAPVPWLATAPVGGRLVLIDTPGPDEELRPGVLNGLVTDAVRGAHDLLVVADATRLENAAEESVRRLIDDALPWPGHTPMLVAVNRADMVRELKPLMGAARAAGNAMLAPELAATWQRLTDGHPQARPRVALTAARHGLAAAEVLWPHHRRAEARQARQEFLQLLRPLDWEDAPDDEHWLRARAQETWHWSGAAGLLDDFLRSRAREPGRYLVAALLHQVASALTPGRGGGVRARLHDLAALIGLGQP